MTRKQPDPLSVKAITDVQIRYVKDTVRNYPKYAQTYLDAEYLRPDGPRWTLVQWLKRHRLHNPTVRVIPNR